MVSVQVVRGRVLHADGALAAGSVVLDGAVIAGVGRGAGETAALPGGVPAGAAAWDFGNLLVLPGIVDLHGDAFERQVMPRPGVHFDHGAALLETDRQLVANGITTAFHGLTYSWEPGLRGGAAARAFLAALDAVRPYLACDTRLHLRHETFNLEAEAEVTAWLAAGRVDLLAFNDHMEHIAGHLEDAAKMAQYAGRAGMDEAEFTALLHAVRARKPEVPDSIARLAARAVDLGVPMASHDDETPADRKTMHALGSRLCEFPVDARTARFARDLGDPVIMGAPNILRGGSHCGRMGAAEAVGEGLCTVLTSDYYYPALLLAAFRLAREEVCYLPDAWDLVSRNPAEAVGLTDRGVLAAGRRGDLVVVDDRAATLPRVVATFVAGRCVYCGLDPLSVLAPSGVRGLAAE